MRAALEAVDVNRTYQMEGVKVAALRGVTVRIAAGEFVAIVGPSGSGKSTLMHLLGCLDRPTSGTMWIDGRDVAALSEGDLAELRNSTIGFVFQGFHLLSRTNARDNVALPLIYRGVPRAERRRRAVAALEAVGLGHRLGHRPGQLSGGEQQRVAIARALANRCSLLIADEPTGNLDSKTGGEILELLRGSVEDYGQTLVMVTHEARAATTADRILFLADGLIVKDLGSTDEHDVLAAVEEITIR